MSWLDRLYRLSAGSMVGLAVFGTASHVLLSVGLPFEPALLPLGLFIGIALASPATLAAPRDPGAIPRWVTVPTLLIIATVTVALAYGSLATPSRMWDGFIAYEVKASYLALEPTLQQDYFMGSGVFCHTRDYPIMQMTTVAAGHRLLGDGNGRALFPLLYGLLVTIVGVAVRYRSPLGWLGPLAALAVAVTPMLVSPTLGGVDSGFADLFLATTVAGIAAGIVLQDPRLLAACAFLAVVVKPEGVVYGALPVLVAWFSSHTRLLRASLFGWIAGSALWLPLQHELVHRGTAPPTHLPVWAALAALGIVVLGSNAWLRRARIGARGRVILAAVAAPLALLAVPALTIWIGGDGGALSNYLGDATRPLQRLPRLPVILAGFLDHAFGRLKYALTFVLLVLLAATFATRRRRPPEVALWSFVLLGLVSCLAAFLLSPEENTAHHVRSTMSRLLLQWLGATWILIGIWLGDVSEQRDG